jgi:hypothetical protein
MKSQLKAKVAFISPDKSGLKTPPRSGRRANLKVNEVFTSCVVHGHAVDQVFEFGVEYDVSLELFFWDHYKEIVKAGMQVQLNDGDRIVGVGVIEAIINE